MRLHLPHPRRAARQRRRDQDMRLRQAIDVARLADRTQQTWDWQAELERRRGRGRGR
jgi:hypothetical protein